MNNNNLHGRGKVKLEGMCFSKKIWSFTQVSEFSKLHTEIFIQNMSDSYWLNLPKTHPQVQKMEKEFSWISEENLVNKRKENTFFFSRKFRKYLYNSDEFVFF